MRTAPERLGAAHRGEDPELARGVVRRRDHPPAMRVAPDDERLLPQLGLLELLDRGEEGIEVEVGDDHASVASARSPAALAAAANSRARTTHSSASSVARLTSTSFAAARAPASASTAPAAASARALAVPMLGDERAQHRDVRPNLGYLERKKSGTCQRFAELLVSDPVAPRLDHVRVSLRILLGERRHALAKRVRLHAHTGRVRPVVGDPRSHPDEGRAHRDRYPRSRAAAGRRGLRGKLVEKRAHGLSEERELVHPDDRLIVLPAVRRKTAARRSTSRPRARRLGDRPSPRRRAGGGAGRLRRWP